MFYKSTFYKSTPVHSTPLHVLQYVHNKDKKQAKPQTLHSKFGSKKTSRSLKTYMYM